MIRNFCLVIILALLIYPGWGCVTLSHHEPAELLYRSRPPAAKFDVRNPRIFLKLDQPDLKRLDVVEEHELNTLRDHLSGDLKNNGFDLVAFPEEADLLLSVRAHYWVGKYWEKTFFLFLFPMGEPFSRQWNTTIFKAEVVFSAGKRKWKKQYLAYEDCTSMKDYDGNTLPLLCHAAEKLADTIASDLKILIHEAK